MKRMNNLHNTPALKNSLVIFLSLIILTISNIHALNLKSLKSSSTLSSELTSEIKSELKSSNSKSSSISSLQLTTKLCNPLCSECSANDTNYCTLCQTHSVFYLYTCYESCPDGTFKDSELKCRPCDISCPVCWGAESTMCGVDKGVRTRVVTLEQEVRDFFVSYTFTAKEIELWISDLKIILINDDKLMNDLIFDNFSTNEIYTTKYSNVELPLGAFSKGNGVFVPVPSYLDSKEILVNSHWVYKKGMWDGQMWVSQHFPRLPLFIKEKGDRNKIYYENNGFWVWSSSRTWFWIKDGANTHVDISEQETLGMLNAIRIDLGDYTKRKTKESQEIKKLSIQNNIRSLFDKFLSTDTAIFKEMKNAMSDEQNNLINSLDDLKMQVHGYFGEESLDNLDAVDKKQPIRRLIEKPAHESLKEETSQERINSKDQRKENEKINFEQFKNYSKNSKDKNKVIAKLVEKFDDLEKFNDIF